MKVLPCSVQLCEEFRLTKLNQLYKAFEYFEENSLNFGFNFKLYSVNWIPKINLFFAHYRNFGNWSHHHSSSSSQPQIDPFDDEYYANGPYEDLACLDSASHLESQVEAQNQSKHQKIENMMTFYSPNWVYLNLENQSLFQHLVCFREFHAHCDSSN